MSTEAARSRVSAEQLELLLVFMEEHPEFAAARQAVYSRFSSSKLWRLLAERLNAASPGARKTPDRWCRFWADLKYKTRKKVSADGVHGELTAAEQRVKLLLDGGVRPDDGGEPAARRGSRSGSETRGESPAAAGADDLLAEAAMRTALAAEKQAESLSQAVELLRELVAAVRGAAAPLAPHVPPPPGMHHHQHRL